MKEFKKNGKKIEGVINNKITPKKIFSHHIIFYRKNEKKNHKKNVQF